MADEGGIVVKGRLELAQRVRPAARAEDALLADEGVELGAAVGEERALEALEEPGGVVTVFGGGEVVQDMTAADVHPQTPLAALAGGAVEEGHPGVIGLGPIGGEQLALHGPHEGPDEPCDANDDVAEGLEADLEAETAHAGDLPVERDVVDELLDDDVRRETVADDGALQGLHAWGVRDGHCVASGAGRAGAHDTNPPKVAGDVVEVVRRAGRERTQRAVAARAGRWGPGR